MAVRFRPTDEGERSPSHDRDDLAEVIELRSRLLAAPQAPGLPAPADTVAAESTPEHSSAEVSLVVEVPAEVSSAAETRDTEIHAMDELREDGVRLLARKARSSGELRAELVKRDHDSHLVEDLIDEFTRSYYLDDLGLARIATENLRENKGASRAQIRQKLRERKFSDDAIETALADLDQNDEDALLRSTAHDRARRLDGLDRNVAERRLLGFLARRGWSGEPAYRAVREALDSRGSGGGVRFR